MRKVLTKKSRAKNNETFNLKIDYITGNVYLLYDYFWSKSNPCSNRYSKTDFKLNPNPSLTSTVNTLT